MKRNLMKEAHKMTREIVNKYGDVDYMTQLGLCLSFLSQEGGKEMVELKGTEKQVKWAEDIRNRIIKVNEIFEKAIEGVDMDKMAKSTWLDDNMYVIAQTSLKNILVQEEAKFFIENFRDLKDLTVDVTKPLDKRLKQYITDVKNPRMVRVGDILVQIEFAGNRSFSDALSTAFQM